MRVRGLALEELAKEAGMEDVAILRAIEDGRHEGSIATWKAIAKALRVEFDDII